MDQEHGETEQSPRRQDVRLELRPDAGELHPVRHSGADGERRRGDRSAAGVAAAEADVQTGRSAVYEAW